MSTPDRSTRVLGSLETEAHAWVRLLTSGAATADDADAMRQWCARSEQHAAAFAAPGGITVMHHQQATSLLLRSEPQALAGRVDGDAFEQRVEMQQHAAGSRLAHHAFG